MELIMQHVFRIHNPRIQLTDLTHWLVSHVGTLVAGGQTHAWGHGWQARYVLEPKDWVWCFKVKLDHEIAPEVVTQFVLTWT